MNKFVFKKAKFVECAACRAKTGSPTLCSECLERREMYEFIDKAEAPEDDSKPMSLAVDPKTKKLDLGSVTMQAGCVHSSSATTACGGCYARYVRVIEDIERHLKDGRYYLIESLLISLDVQMRAEFDEVHSKKKGKKR